MEARIRAKLGSLEVEFEGSEDFLKNHLLELLHSFSELDVPAESGSDEEESQNDDGSVGIGGQQGSNLGTTTTFAAKLGGGSGNDLLLAAAAKLAIGDGLERFTRKRLLEEMKAASAYYKKSYSGNLTKYIEGLVKSHKLLEQAKDTYSLASDTRTELRKRLGL